MPDDTQLAVVERRQEALIQGVAQMNDTLGLLSAMLEQILKAATQPPPKSELAEALQRIAAILTEQQEALTTLDDRLLTLPDKIAEALTTDPSH